MKYRISRKEAVFFVTECVRIVPHGEETKFILIYQVSHKYILITRKEA